MGALADTDSIPARTSSPPHLSHFVFITSYLSAMPLLRAPIDTHTHLILSPCAIYPYLICPLRHLSCHTLNSDIPLHSTHMTQVLCPQAQPPLHVQQWISCGSSLLVHQLFSSFGIHTILLLACVSPHFSDFCACLTCPVLFHVYLFLLSFSPLSRFPLTLRSFLCSSLSDVFVYLLLDSKVSDGHL